MSDTTQSCAGSPWPEASFVPYGEYESGFLLPQLMGALASEFGGLELSGASQRRSAKPSLLKRCTSLMQALNPGSVFLKRFRAEN
ncbi:MAG: hypothetical protein JWP42_3901 [Pseudomonas sp.]|nr:hypothetical protein [Pseudomonas sp.]